MGGGDEFVNIFKSAIQQGMLQKRDSPPQSPPGAYIPPPQPELEPPRPVINPEVNENVEQPLFEEDRTSGAPTERTVTEPTDPKKQPTADSEQIKGNGKED